MSGIIGIDAARAYFEGDRFAVNAGISIDEVAPGYAVCHFDITPDHLNAENGVMGGAIFTLIDLAFAAAANGIHLPTVAQQVSMNFLSGSRGATLTATARCRKDGRTSTIVTVDVTDEKGNDVALFTGTGFKL